MNRTLWILFTGLILLLAACAREQDRSFQAEDTPVETEAAATEATPTAVPTGITILADGVIEAVQPALPLSFETGGKLLTLEVQAGDVVQAGDLIATLDDAALQEAIANTGLQVDQAENSLAQAQADLDNLLNWEPDELAVAQAQANLTAAETALVNAETQDAVAGNSVTQARVSVEQAERAVVDAQEAYDTAYDPGREWQLNDPWRADFLKNEREATTRNLEFANEQLEVARANYALAIAGVNNDTAVSAAANVASAQQAVDQAQQGPKEAEIEAARLRLEQAEIALAQSELSLSQAEAALAKAELIAPWAGTVLRVETAPGALVGSGSPIVTLLDMTQLEFHTTNLSERDLAQISPGLPAVITLKAYPNDPIPATVARIGLQAGTAVGDAATFPVILALAEPELDIRPGMTGRAEISRGE